METWSHLRASGAHDAADAGRSPICSVSGCPFRRHRDWGGTLLAWIGQGLKLDVTWCVMSATGDRVQEARKSAHDFLSGAAGARADIMQFRTGFFPAQSEAVKHWFELLKASVNHPDIIFTHRRDDAHQDHREVSRHTWSTFRYYVEYEIPKWDGDMGQPNLYVPLSAKVLQRKVTLLLTHFERNGPGTGSMRRRFAGSPACAAWNAAHPSVMRKRFSPRSSS